MPQFETISEKSKSIVLKYIEGTSSYLTYFNKGLELIVSLYATTPEADNKILYPLKEYHINLRTKLTVKEIGTLQKEYSAVIRFCYEHYETFLHRRIADYPRPIHKLPKYLFELCHLIMSPKQGSKIFLPNAGDAQFAHTLSNCSFDGYEPGYKMWAYCQILCGAYHLDAEIQFGVSFVNIEKKLYDYVFYCFDERRDIHSIADELYNIATAHLNDNGTMCCILPESFCFASEWYNFRKILIDKKGEFSATILSLPTILHPYPIENENVCMCVLCKNNTDTITLMNVKDDTFFTNPYSPVEEGGNLNIKLLPIFETLKLEDKKYVWCGTSADLSEHINLMPSRYLVKQYLPTAAKGEKYVKLGDIIEVVSYFRSFAEMYEFFRPLPWNMEAGPYLKFQDLSADPLICDISYTYTYKNIPKRGFSIGRRLTENCLLIGYINGMVKVGRAIDFSSSDFVYLSEKIIPFKLKPNTIVSEDFLLGSLVSDNVVAQFKLLTWGGYWAHIDDVDFLQIEILVPSNEEQARLNKESYQKSLGEASRKLSDVTEDFRKDIHMKKHAIGQTISNLENWWSVLQRARVENNGVLTDDTIVGQIKKTTVGEIYTNLENVISQLQEQIYRLDRGNGLKAEDFAPTSFFEEYISIHKSPDFEFEYNAEKHHEESMEYVKFPREALTIVMDNIVSNACNHGFTDPSEENKILIDFDWVGGYIVATVSNNGRPLHEEMTPDRVFLYGESSKNGEGHFGLGGYEIKRLMQEFGGDAEIESTPSGEFTVTYKLTFPEAG